MLSVHCTQFTSYLYSEDYDRVVTNAQYTGINISQYSLTLSQ